MTAGAGERRMLILIFKIDSSVWDKKSWADVIQQGKITVEEEKL